MAEHLVTSTVAVTEDECVEKIQEFEAEGWAVREVIPMTNRSGEHPCHAVVVFEKREL